MNNTKVIHTIIFLNIDEPLNKVTIDTIFIFRLDGGEGRKEDIMLVTKMLYSLI